MSKILFFDSETTGLIPKGINYREHYEQYPYIVQLSWEFDGELKDFIIKPEDWYVPVSSTEIHGISHEKALAEGHNFNDVIVEFINDCQKADTIIGFNMYFDTSIIKANIIRAMPDAFVDLSDCALSKDKRLDLMFKTIKFVGARKENGSGKFPTLIELYNKLFNEEFPAHNSAEDVKATKRCYEELKERGVI